MNFSPSLIIAMGQQQPQSCLGLEFHVQGCTQYLQLSKAVISGILLHDVEDGKGLIPAKINLCSVWEAVWTQKSVPISPKAPAPVRDLLQGRN